MKFDPSKLATFKNDRLSVSRMKMYEQCRLSFFFRYVDRENRDAIDVWPKGEAANFGTVLHAALEMLYLWIVEEQYEGRFPESQLIVFYREAWQASGLNGVGLYQEGLELLRTYANTHTMVDHMQILSVEQEFNLTIDGYTLNGYIDRVDKVNDETIKITDYKSSRMLFTKDELRTDLQMSIYGLAARALYPWAKRVMFSFWMLRHDTAQTTERDAKTIDDAIGYVVALGRRTETDKDWAPTLNPNCAYCDFRRRCPKYAEAIAGKLDYPKAENTEDLAQVAAERESVHQIAKAAYARKDELDKILKEAMRARDEEKLIAGDWSYRNISGGWDRQYEVQRTLELFTEAGVSREEIMRRVLRADPKAVDEMRDELFDKLGHARGIALRRELEAIESKTPNTPRFTSSPLRKAKTPKAAKGK